MVGTWKLVYSTITILGSKRTKLGLRDFISLGDFYQNIDVAEVCLHIYIVMNFFSCAIKVKVNVVL